MGGLKMGLMTRLAEKWEQLVSVSVVDEEEARKGRLFEILMVIALATGITIAIFFLLLIWLAKTPTFVGSLATVASLSFIPLTVFCFIQAKKGQVRTATLVYVWSNLFFLALSTWIFDGIYSPVWVLHIWTITIAGTLLAPVYALWMAGVVVGYFLLLLFLHQSGLYIPPLTLGRTGIEVANKFFLLVEMVSVVGLLTYLNMRSLNDALDRLRTTKGELEEHRGTLEKCVKERTEELIKANVALDQLATHDVLTGLSNRMLFTQLLNRAILTARRYERQFAVFFIDLDRFKIINDTLGHEAGDQLLQEIAMRLKHSLRSSDVIARFGGDEFVLLVDEVKDLSQVATVAQTVLSTAGKPVVIMGEEFHVTASIGISIYPKDAQEGQSLMKTADIAMYLAKERGKNNYQFYSKEIHSKSIEQQSTETNLHSVWDRRQFYTFDEI